MKTLRAVVKLPFGLPSGEIVKVPGYNAETETYADFDGELFEDLPDRPSRAELVVALRQIWRPWAAYRFATAHDRAAMLAAIIGGVCRPGLDLAPGVLLDAPMAGSGKTLAARALGSLILGRRCPVTVGVNLADDDETRKLLVADAIAGVDVVLLDNLHGHLSSPALEGLITAGVLRGRVLGSSQNFEGEVRGTVLLTSNNASLSRDLARRFLRVRIDHGVERPQGLEFAFDPVERALTERLAIARGVLVVVSGFFAAGSPVIGRGDAGFAQWNRLVRQCVLWLGDEGLDEEAGVGGLGDPAHSIMEEAGRSDPDSEALAMLLDGLSHQFGSTFFYAREVAVWLGCGLTDEASATVREALDLLMPGRSHLSAASIGNILKYRVDRPSCGLVLRSGPGARKTTAFSVQAA